MAIDRIKMRKRVDESARGEGGDLLDLEVGDTKLFIHGLVYPDDDHELTSGLNYLETLVHFRVGGKMVVCLDARKNPIVTHPIIQRFLSKRKTPLKVSGKSCPVCTAIANGEMDEEAASESRPQSRYLWGVTPIAFRRRKAGEWKAIDDAGPSILFCGKMVWDGLTGFIIDSDEDVTDPKAAGLVIVSKTGKGMSTRYDVKADPQTQRKPMALPKALRAELKDAMAPEGSCDLFRALANMIKGEAEVKALIDGVEIDDDDDLDEEEEPRKSRKRSKLVVEEDDDDLDDEGGLDDEEDLDEEEEAPKPSKSKKAKAKPAPVDDEDDNEDDEEDDDEDDDGDEDGEEADADDDDDDGLAAIDAEIERMTKKRKKAARG